MRLLACRRSHHPRTGSCHTPRFNVNATACESAIIYLWCDPWRGCDYVCRATNCLLEHCCKALDTHYVTSESVSETRRKRLSQRL